MAEITESRIKAQMSENACEYGIDESLPYAHELAELQLKDLQRKGCTLEGPDCRGCQFMGQECPLQTWFERHPEFKNDELSHRIEVLEAGGEEAYKAKLKAREEARRKAEEEAQKATDTDRAEACRYLLNLFYKSKTTATEGGILDLVNNILYAKTKSEISDEVAKTA